MTGAAYDPEKDGAQMNFDGSMSYADYLSLDPILSAQHPRSDIVGQFISACISLEVINHHANNDHRQRTRCSRRKVGVLRVSLHNPLLA